MSLRAREVQLDFVRGLAILLAMGWHLNSGEMETELARIVLLPGTKFGWAGVDLFFVLSGFLVGGLVIREVVSTRGFDCKRFLIRRAFRLWPVLYVYLAAQILLTDKPVLSYLPQVALHVQNFWLTPLSHLWSLAVEEQFYLIVGLSLPLILRINVRSRHVLLTLFVIASGSFIVRPFAYYAGVSDHAIQVQTQFRLDGLAIGVLLAVLNERYPEFYVLLRSKRVLNFTLACGCYAGLWWLDTPALRCTIGYTVAAIGGGFAILAFHQMPGTAWSSPLFKFVATLGLWSYPMYLWHNAIGNKITPELAKLAGLTSPDVITLLKYVLSITFAYIMVMCVERPCMRLRDQIFARQDVLAMPNRSTA